MLFKSYYLDFVVKLIHVQQSKSMCITNSVRTLTATHSEYKGKIKFLRVGGRLNISKTLVSIKWSLVVKITVPLCTHFFFSFEQSDFLIFQFCGMKKKSLPVNQLHKSNNNNNRKTTIMTIHSSRPASDAVYTD